MGTLGEYLRKAREARDMDIRDAAQQTRIGISYLKALEEEDFAKLPGDVFVKGFLKSYGRFLNLDEAELLRRFGELNPKTPAPPAAAAAAEKSALVTEAPVSKKTTIEPFLWGTAICISLLVFLFASLPSRHARKQHQPDMATLTSMLSSTQTNTGQVQPIRSEKLYLELVAMEDTWLLVRTDTSPQKKAVLKKGESLIWSADDRFLLSYGGVGALKLLLNGEELSVKGSKDTAVRDLAITRTGVVNQPVPVKQPAPARPRPKPVQTAGPAAPASAAAQPSVVQPSQPSAVPAAAPAEQKPEQAHPSLPVSQ